MLSSYMIDGNKITIKTAYCDDVVATCRKWAGKFDRASGGWVVPITRLAEVQRRLGRDVSDQVEIEVGLADLDSKYAQYAVGWFVVAGRRGRDNFADVYADLVAGTIPATGGSVKNPLVSGSGDVRFRLWVPRDFATARNLQIVTDPRAGSGIDREALVAERAKLVARIAEIDAILG